MKPKGLCKDCLYLKQEWVVDWNHGEPDELFISLDRYCSICDIFKRLDGYCDLWQKA